MARLARRSGLPLDGIAAWVALLATAGAIALTQVVIHLGHWPH